MNVFSHSKINSILILFIIVLTFLSCDNKQTSLDLSMYEYRDTKKLVKFAYDAAQLIKEKGLKGIDILKQNRKKYSRENLYLYVYKLNGKNLFHGGVKEFEGSNLSEIMDLGGKKVHKLALKALNNEHNPHGWVHYNWWKPERFYPVPKSSCHFKVTTQEGVELYVGAGMDYPHEEKEFIKILVKTAIDLIKEKGESAFPELRDPTSQFIYREVKIFVIDNNGKNIISPVINNSPIEINILNSKDAAGHKPFQRALKILQNKDFTWEVFLAKSRSKRILQKKTLYLRKLQLNKRIIYVGAITDMPEPAWTS